ncbi:MAG: Wzy polymerase domain-containing protein [Sterolibacterium sp.]
MTNRSFFYEVTLKTSLAAACLMFVVPFLNSSRYAPMPGFYSEWWAAALLLGAGVVLLRREVWTMPLLPKIVLLPVGLIAITLLQWIFGQGGQVEFLIFFLFYLLGAAFAMVVGQCLRQSVGLGRMTQALASFLLLGALACALIAVLSKFAPQVLPALIVNNQGAAVAVGNLMQSNHLDNYLWMGIAAACCLHLSRRISGRWLMAALVPLLLVSSMTSSRSSLIYLIGLNLFALLWWFHARSSPHARRALRVSLLLVPGFILAETLCPGEFTSAMTRMSSDVSVLFVSQDMPIAGASIRIPMIKVAMALFAEHPWLGNGIHSYAWGDFVLTEQFQLPTQNPTGHAHNLFAHLLAELGIGSVLVLVATLTVFVRGLAKQRWTSAHFWLMSVLMIEAWHSMIEYPLWYAYFLLPTALLLGAADIGAITLRPSLSLRGSATALLLVGAAALLNLRSDYQRFEYALYPQLKSDHDSKFARSFAEITPDLVNLHRDSLLSPYVGLIYAVNLAPIPDSLQAKLAITYRAMHFVPYPQIVFNYAVLLALAEREEEALRQQRWAIRRYPGELPKYIQTLKLVRSEAPLPSIGALLQAAEAEAGRVK